MNKDGTTGMPCWKKLALAGSCVLALSLLLCFGLRLALRHDYDTALAVGSHLWMLLNLLLLWEYTGGRTALDGRGLARYALLQVGIAVVCTLPFCLLGQSGTCLPALLQPAGALLQLLIAFGLMLLCRRTGKRS